ncbi:MAG: hypothetical protein H8E26_07375 [FCB group bacterium]|nr:hypothetical protein [FCB group bacterium]MBL7029090.1 hypothetical protein [Candidatus Neomarinimicrobiota bacterium]MBL7122570.1 hypothetical protein [Candidatus Neomarinimicrobiota bacterium]
MQDILDLLLSNKLYMGVAVFVGIGLLIFLMKKVFKLFMILMFVVLAYGVFIYVTEDDPWSKIKKQMSPAMEKLDDATQDLQQEAIDKVIDEVDKQLKKAGNN